MPLLGQELLPVLGPEQWCLGLVVILPALLSIDGQPETELRPLGEGGEHLLLGAGREARGGQVRAQHQGVENLQPVQGWVVPTPLALLHIRLEVDVPDSQ